MDFYKEINKTMQKMQPNKFEIIFVDDGSTDNTLAMIMQLSQNDKSIKYISFSRNFGKEAAMMAGLEHSAGDYVAIIDADLQDPPQMLSQMYNDLQTLEYDCVAARRTDRKGEPPIRSFLAKAFYKIINKLSKTPIVDGARDFRLMTRQMVNAILKLPEYNRFSKGLFQWVGFKTKWISYENVLRKKGSTKWSFTKLFLYSLDGIVAFSTVPLALASVVGILISAIAVCLGAFFICQKVFVGIDVQGYAAMIVIILFLGGLQLFCMGILGQYLSKIYLEVKARPKYIVKDTNCDER